MKRSCLLLLACIVGTTSAGAVDQACVISGRGHFRICVDYRAGRFPFAYNGRALGRDEPEGFIKMLADAKTDRILGVHALGGQASELIAEAVVAMEFGASSEDIARICHAHPSMSEVMREAALAVDKRSLNG